MAALHESILATENKITWHPHKKRLHGEAPAKFFELHPDPKKLELQRNKVISDVSKNVDLLRVDLFVEQEGITREQHHHITSPFSK